MKRALMTALLVSAKPDRDQARGPVRLTLVPDLREQVTYKNTVASSVEEIKSFVAEVLEEA